MGGSEEEEEEEVVANMYITDLSEEDIEIAIKVTLRKTVSDR